MKSSKERKLDQGNCEVALRQAQDIRRGFVGRKPTSTEERSDDTSTSAASTEPKATCEAITRWEPTNSSEERDKTGPQEPEQDWKVPRKRRRMLLKLGVAKDQVKKASRSRKGYWSRVAGSRNSLVNLALSGRYLEEQGVPSMRALWVTFKYRDKAQL